MQTSNLDNPRIILGFDICAGNSRIVLISTLSDQSSTLHIYSSGQGTVNMPKPLSSLARCVPRSSNTASLITIYDRIDTAATINFSTQFGAATIRERRLFHSALVYTG